MNEPSAIPLCVCGHADDHPRKKCRHENPQNPALTCDCKFGQRTDLAICDLLNQQGMVLSQISAGIARLIAIAESASGLETKLVDAGNGRGRVEVKKRVPGLVLPGM